MKALLRLKSDPTEPPVSDATVAKGLEVACRELSRARIVVERVRPEDGLLVLRVARQPARKNSVPAHFLLLDYEVRNGEVWVETEPVMLLPAKKGDFVRDQTTVEQYEDK